VSNAEYIEKYKGQDEIIRTWFQVRDRKGRVSDVKGLVNPLRVDNRQLASPTDQQGEKPHCAAYSVCGLIEAVNWKRTGRICNLDADQVYARAKTLDGQPGVEGTYLEFAIRAAAELGGLANPAAIKVGFVPNGGDDRTVEQVKYLVHKYDFLHAGFSITTGWYSCGKDDPVVKHTDIGMGGHAVLIVGYDQAGAYVQNSWGKEWGSMGFAVVPWDVFKKEFMYGCYLQNCYDGLAE